MRKTSHFHAGRCMYCVYIHDYVTVHVIQPVTPSKDFVSICVNGNRHCRCAAVYRKTSLLCHVPIEWCEVAVQELNNLNGS